jgi:hypothetical protein
MTLANMAGRQAFNVPPDNVCNPIEPWGPGICGGPSGLFLDVLAGLQPPEAVPTWWAPAHRALMLIFGATLHELLHCLGIRHSHESVDGPEAWLSPMGAQWNWPDDGHGKAALLLPRERAEIRGERDVSGPFNDGPRAGAHFFRGY